MVEYPALAYDNPMNSTEPTDLYICALLTQMITAREGDVKREFQAVYSVLHRLRGYSEEQVLLLLQDSLALADNRDFEALVGLCKDQLSDEQIKEAIGLLAYLARIDGDVSAAEEDIFARLCVGLGVTVNDGNVEIDRGH
jgi:uncharacterized tellurite resistance protein B-like protein